MWLVARLLRYYLLIVLLVASGSTFPAFREMLPPNDWKDPAAALLSLGVFCSFQIIHYLLRNVYSEMEPEGRHPLANIACILGITVIFSVSTPATTIALSGQAALVQDIQLTYQIANEALNEATRAFRPASSIRSLIAVKAEEARKNAKNEITGNNLTGLPSGKGPVYLRHIELSEKLDSLGELIELNVDEAESIIQQMNIVLSRMRAIIDEENNIKTKVAKFEAIHRGFSQLHIRLSELDLIGQVDKSLSELTRSSILAHGKQSKKALRVVDAEISRLTGNISEIIQSKLFKIKPIEVYRKPSFAQATFKHLFSFPVQFFVALSFDICGVLILFLRISVAHQARNSGEDTTLYSARDLSTLANSLGRILDARKQSDKE